MVIGNFYWNFVIKIWIYIYIIYNMYLMVVNVLWVWNFFDVCIMCLYIIKYCYWVFGCVKSDWFFMFFLDLNFCDFFVFFINLSLFIYLLEEKNYEMFFSL